MLYKNIIRPILFKFDPENIHDFSINALRMISNSSFYSLIRKTTYFYDPILETELFGFKFRNPIGLAAGFDKQIVCPKAWEMLGFGFAEVGSITYEPQPGNYKPRLWRLPRDKALIVYYGLNSVGALCIKDRAEDYFKKLRESVFGLSIAKSTNVSDSEAVQDYLKTFRLLKDFADYITLNVSCPNVAHFTEMQKKYFLENLVIAIQKENEFKKPVFLKIGPDNSDNELKEIIDIALRHNISAIVATNLSKKNHPPIKGPIPKEAKGGISGKVVEEKANGTIRQIYKLSGGRITIIGVGGIFTGQDAYNKIKAGASLLQLITGFVYGGPFTIKRICQKLADLLKKDGFSSIEEAVGVDVK